MRTIETFCPLCDEPVVANVEIQEDTLPIRGVPTTFSGPVAVCPLCGETIGDSRVEQENFEAAYAVYRAENGVIAPDEIKAVRKALGLSLREFSVFLGFGEQTVVRYENGTLPDDLHNNTMRMASTREGAQMLFNLNGEKLSKSSQKKVRKCLGLEEDACAGFVLHPLAASVPLLV